MNRLLSTVVALSILLLSGCASNPLPIQPILSSKHTPELNSSYVGGMFSQDWGADKIGFGIGLVNIATAEEYIVPFGENIGLPRSISDEFVMVQLPPGGYRVSYWVIYSSNETEKISQTEIPPNSLVGSTFALAPGEVVFIGSHVARDTHDSNSNGNKTWVVRHQQLSLRTVQKVLSNRYPAFVPQPLRCPSCLK